MDDDEKNTKFASRTYWESRYATDPAASFEWVKGWDFYRSTVAPLIPSKSLSILHLGCGNSRFSVDMLEQDGFTNHTNIDYSANVIENMKAAHLTYPTIRWIVGDIFELQVATAGEMYDTIIDKGTLDAFLTGFPDDDPWDPSQECLEMVERYLHQVCSVLKPGGLFIQITWAQPHFRKRLVGINGLEVTVKKVGSDWEYFVYVCKKNTPT
ncbi:hypothetical protein HDU84_005946 [Entophlyctis sp. JEL0112]|nr:hypothetical protein HDU84_005946 [Entophlyctis sp. JEL0112]